MTDDGLGHTYGFNAENRMVSGSNGTDSFVYAYDPFGRRMVKDVNDGETFVRYVYDGPHVVAELDEEGTVLRTYVYGPGMDEPLMMRVHIPNESDEDYYYHRDALGNVMALSDENGNIVEGYTYSAFGVAIVNTDDGPDGDWLTPDGATSDQSVYWIGNPYMFTSRRYDPESGLYYYRARYYDPTLGRFISADPISYRGGINLYAYCGNNPITWRDPLGLYTYRIPLTVPVVGIDGTVTNVPYVWPDGTPVEVEVSVWWELHEYASQTDYGAAAQEFFFWDIIVGTSLDLIGSAFLTLLTDGCNSCNAYNFSIPRSPCLDPVPPQAPPYHYWERCTSRSLSHS